MTKIRRRPRTNSRRLRTGKLRSRGMRNKSAPSRFNDSIESPAVNFDVILMGDMTRTGETTVRIALEGTASAQAGYRTGLVHIPSQWAGDRIAPDIQALARSGKAEIVGPTIARTRVLIGYAPHSLFHKSAPLPQHLARITADQVVLVTDQLPSFDVLDRQQIFALLFGPVTWAPTNPWIRENLLQTPVVLHHENWRPVLQSLGIKERTSMRPIVGRASGRGTAQWPKSVEELFQTFPIDGSFDVRLAGPPANLFGSRPLPAAWQVFAPSEISIEKFVRDLDFFVFFPGPAISELPDVSVAIAMDAGTIVVLPPRLRQHYGPGPVYCEAPDVPKTIRDLYADPTKLDAIRRRGAAAAAEYASFRSYADRLSAYAGKRPKRHVESRSTRSSRPPRALFLASNGTGLGHVARLLAIARRCDRIEPIFATMTQAVEIITSFGYHAEYLPSVGYTEAEVTAWDAWFRVELEQIIDANDIKLVVFDGNHPMPGLVQAVSPRSDCRLAWIRRGMWGRGSGSDYLTNARFFDLIIEPGDIAGERDTGVTASRRHEVTTVDPIVLLDENEVLPRKAARRALGLDPARPAVLIHLGAGSNRDIVSITDRIVGDLRQNSLIQIAVAEWAIGSADLALWPGVLVVKGFPISRYFKAFDFSIAAAGYNTFHEVLAYQLPTIFIPNVDPSMDDQAARASFAQDAEAAFELPESNLGELPALIEVLVNLKARQYLRSKCRRLRRGNGALAAANELARLAGGRIS